MYLAMPTPVHVHSEEKLIGTRWAFSPSKKVILGSHPSDHVSLTKCWICACLEIDFPPLVLYPYITMTNHAADLSNVGEWVRFWIHGWDVERVRWTPVLIEDGKDESKRDDDVIDAVQIMWFIPPPLYHVWCMLQTCGSRVFLPRWGPLSMSA